MRIRRSERVLRFLGRADPSTAARLNRAFREIRDGEIALERSTLAEGLYLAFLGDYTIWISINAARKEMVVQDVRPSLSFDLP